MARRRRRSSRIYWRHQGGETRAYGDFRDYADVGGAREALIPPGARTATTDRVVAEKLVADRLKEFQERRRNRMLLGVENQTTLAAFAQYHLEQKAKAGNVTYGHLAETEHRLGVAIESLGVERELASVKVADVQRYLGQLRERPNGRGGTLSAGSLRHYLAALSHLYARAQAEGYVPPGYNPVSTLMDKPRRQAREARWLEAADAALLLEAARTFRPRVEDGAVSFGYELLGTFLLTGGRSAEVLGLEVADVSFDRRTVTFRPNGWRRLKTARSQRVVPLWPQLEEILRPYVFDRKAPLGSLLFPSPKSQAEAIISDWRKTLDAVAERAGWQRSDIRSKMFRHTYAAARLQTLDHGAPVSVYTVSRELGHSSTQMVERIYSHLGEIRHRSEVVEYRVEQHVKVLGERLVAIRAGK